MKLGPMNRKGYPLKVAKRSTLTNVDSVIRRFRLTVTIGAASVQLLE
jgi:hypothetical protein